jgi:hypothetical protein
VQDRFQSVENALSQLNLALAPHSEMAAKLKDYDGRMQGYVMKVKADCKALQTQIEAERRENLLAREQVERDVLRRMVCPYASLNSI